MGWGLRFVGRGPLSCLFGLEAEQFRRGEEKVAVAVHLDELLHRSTLLPPLVQADLTVAVGVVRTNQSGNPGGNFPYRIAKGSWLLAVSASGNRGIRGGSGTRKGRGAEEWSLRRAGA